MPSRAIGCGIALAAICLLTPLAAQQAEVTFSDDATISVDVDVVNILASVRDKQGRLIDSLERDDFVLEEDGKPQTVKYFSRQTDLPLTLGLLVDTSISQRNVIGIQRQAAFEFLSRVLRHKKDLAFLMSFDVDVELLQDLTDSQRLLSDGLNKLEIQGSYSGLHPGPVPTSRRPVGTALYDSVYLAANELMRQQVGRKALVLISDGNDYGSRVKLDEAIEAAHRSDVVIYSVRYWDRRFYRQAGVTGGGGGGTLKKLARETGGAAFEVSRKQPLREIFDQIQAELRSQYSIGYTPADLSQPGFRKIKLRTKNKSLKVQARSGYYPKS